MTRPGTPPTARELEALRAVCQPGGSRDTAAHELGVSTNAIKHRLLRVNERLGTDSTAQAVFALRKSL